MKRILFYITQFYKGGAEVSLLNLLNNVDKNRYHIEFLIANNSISELESLVTEVARHIVVCDAYQEDQKRGKGLLKYRFLYKKEERLKFGVSQLEFVKNKFYDAAFHIGEWSSPEFVATKVNADKKYIWSHTDLNDSVDFNEDEFFLHIDSFDKIIFVSKNSMERSCEKYRFLENKSVVVHNINNYTEIARLSLEKVTDLSVSSQDIVLLTVGNLRAEKNHLKQVEVLVELKRRGVKAKWINIGNISDKGIYNRVRDRVKQLNLEQDFLILGPKKNPYKYMKIADIVTVLSDYESWSMVITEALTLEKLVVATRTSGALEQIVDGKNGILTGFETENIADAIERAIITKKEVHSGTLISQEKILREFDRLFDEPNKKNKVLYCIDNINYNGGAHIATENQISLLSDEYEIEIFSDKVPNIFTRNRFSKVRFLNFSHMNLSKLFYSKITFVLLLSDGSFSDKTEKIKMSFNSKILRKENTFQKYVLSKMHKFLETRNYNSIIVMSEASIFREQVSRITGSKKIQWIHTDYVVWKDLNDWTRNLTKDDERIYSNFDQIILLSNKLKEKFDEAYPLFCKKTLVIPNIFDAEKIKKMSKKEEVKPYPVLNTVSVGRLDQYKDYLRLFTVIKRLVDSGYRIQLDLIGDGEQWALLKDYIEKNDLSEYIKMRGFQKNPYPYFKGKDLFVLASHYEGTPNTIAEAFFLGVPVLSTDVGGVCDQIQDKITGWLVEDREEELFDKLKFLIENHQEVEKCKKNLERDRYIKEYEQEEIIKKIESLLK